MPLLIEATPRKRKRPSGWLIVLALVILLPAALVAVCMVHLATLPHGELVRYGPYSNHRLFLQRYKQSQEVLSYFQDKPPGFFRRESDTQATVCVGNSVFFVTWN